MIIDSDSDDSGVECVPRPSKLSGYDVIDMTADLDDDSVDRGSDESGVECVPGPSSNDPCRNVIDMTDLDEEMAPPKDAIIEDLTMDEVRLDNVRLL